MIICIFSYFSSAAIWSALLYLFYENTRAHQINKSKFGGRIKVISIDHFVIMDLGHAWIRSIGNCIIKMEPERWPSRKNFFLNPLKDLLNQRWIKSFQRKRKTREMFHFQCEIHEKIQHEIVISGVRFARKFQTYSLYFGLIYQLKLVEHV